MRRVCVGSFTLREIHLENEFARPASAWLNHWTIRHFHHLDGFPIQGSGMPRLHCELPGRKIAPFGERDSRRANCRACETV